MLDADSPESRSRSIHIDHRLMFTLPDSRFRMSFTFSAKVAREKLDNMGVVLQVLVCSLMLLSRAWQYAASSVLGRVHRSPPSAGRIF